MKALFEPRETHSLDLVVIPETDHERLLLAAWMRYDANQVSMTVRRQDNGLIERVALRASDAE